MSQKPSKTVPAAAPLTVSFEFFPPKTRALEIALWNAAQILKEFDPTFVSVTYGAGGTTRARTHDIVTRLQEENGLKAAAHLTCVGATREEIDEIAKSYWQSGIKHLVALRGDPPGGMDAAYQPHPGGYAYADDLVAGLIKIAPFELSVAAYPEVHPAALSAQADIDNLKRKVDAGAVRAISQFFFDNDKFFAFRDKAYKAGVRVPIVPGILPITNFARAQEFAGKCNATIPDSYHQLFAGHDTAPVYVKQQTAVDAAVEQCQELRAGGCQHIHFYTLNKADLVARICQQLGMAQHLVLEEEVVVEGRRAL